MKYFYKKPLCLILSVAIIAFTAGCGTTSKDDANPSNKSHAQNTENGEALWEQDSIGFGFKCPKNLKLYDEKELEGIQSTALDGFSYILYACDAVEPGSKFQVLDPQTGKAVERDLDPSIKNFSVASIQVKNDDNTDLKDVTELQKQKITEKCTSNGWENPDFQVMSQELDGKSYTSLDAQYHSLSGCYICETSFFIKKQNNIIVITVWTAKGYAMMMDMFDWFYHT